MERQPFLDTCLYEIVSLFSVLAVTLTSLPHHEVALNVHTFGLLFCLLEVREIWQTFICTSCTVGVDQCGSKLKHSDHFYCKFHGNLFSISEGETSTQTSISLSLSFYEPSPDLRASRFL